MSKKILSVVVALVLVFSLVSTFASAAIADGKQCAIILTADKTEVAAGDTITITLSGECTDDFGDLGNVVTMLAYDSAKVDIDAAVKAGTIDGAVLNPTAYLNPCDGVDANMTYSSAWGTGAYDELLACADGYEATYTAKGWDSAVVSTLLVNTNLASGSNLCTYTFTVADSVQPGDTFTIGIPEGSLYDGGGNAFTNITDIWEIDMEPCYDLSQAEITFTVPADEDPIVWKQNQVRPAESGIANAIDIGVKAEFTKEDIPITFDAKGTSDNFAAVGAVLKVNGTAMDPAESAFVYEVSEGVFQYRVIIVDVAKDSDDVYTLQFYAKDTNGNYTYGETVDVTVADCDLSGLPA